MIGVPSLLHVSRLGHSWYLPWSGIEPRSVKPLGGGSKQLVSRRDNWAIHPDISLKLHSFWLKQHSLE